MTLKRYNLLLTDRMMDHCNVHIVLKNFFSSSTGACGVSGGSKVAQHLQGILYTGRARVQSRGNLAGHEPAVQDAGLLR